MRACMCIPCTLPASATPIKNGLHLFQFLHTVSAHAVHRACSHYGEKQEFMVERPRGLGQDSSHYKNLWLSAHGSLARTLRYQPDRKGKSRTLCAGSSILYEISKVELPVNKRT